MNRKRWISALALLVLMLLASAALAAQDNGFALVNKNKVNLRREPEGTRIGYLDKGMTVFVAETRAKGQTTWHRVIMETKGDAKSGWVDARFLTEVRDAFAGVQQAVVGERHALLRLSDGTAAGFGTNFQHTLDVTRWRNLTDIAAGRFVSVGLTADGEVKVTYPDRLEEARKWRGVQRFITNTIGSDMVLALTADGRLAEPVSEALQAPLWAEDPRALGGLTQTAFSESFVAGLTEDGRVRVAVRNVNDSVQAEIRQTDGLSGVRKIAAGRHALYLLMQDGTVQGFGAAAEADGGDDWRSWRDVKDLAASCDYVAAVLSDGTVRMSGRMVSIDYNMHHVGQERQVNLQEMGLLAGWKDIASLAAGETMLVGIRRDGGIEAAAAWRFER